LTPPRTGRELADHTSLNRHVEIARRDGHVGVASRIADFGVRPPASHRIAFERVPAVVDRQRLEPYIPWHLAGRAEPMAKGVAEIRQVLSARKQRSDERLFGQSGSALLGRYSRVVSARYGLRFAVRRVETPFRRRIASMRRRRGIGSEKQGVSCRPKA
jgi:hypothetical protein